jgi:hypothetical protein
MPTEQEVDLEARLLAIENVLTRLTAMALFAFPDAKIRAAHDMIRRDLQNITFGTSADPVLKDHFAAQIAEHMEASIIGDLRATQRRSP